MGELRFIAPGLTDSAWQRAYMSGMDGVPWHSHNRRRGEQWVLARPVRDSGNLFVPWQLDGLELTLSTATLMERDTPYLLPLELARGTLNRLRSQMVEWEAAGLQLPADLAAKTQHATSLFTRALAAVERDVNEALAAAEQAIQRSARCLEQLGVEYSRQALEFRHQQSPRLGTMLAVNIGHARPYEGEGARRLVAAFNTAVIPINWRQLEPNTGEYCWDELDQQVQWCEQRSLRICVGPLLRPSPGLLPEWIYLWEEDFDQLQSCAAMFVQEVVRRYKGRVHLWHAASRLNVAGALSIGEEARLRLAVRSIEAVRQVDPQTPVVTSVDQPWGEHLAREDLDLSPLHFADALVRADLGLAGIGLEINFGQHPRGTQPRDPVELCQQIDRWSLLGLPLLVLVTVPGGDTRDGAASCPQFRTPEQQAEQTARLLSIFLAKTIVHGIVWNQLDDGQAQQPYPCGLFDDAHVPKPVLQTITQLRRDHLH